MISNSTLESAQDGDETAWYQIGRELEDVGITSSIVQENRAFIIAWIKDALKRGQLEEQTNGPEEGPTFTIQDGPKFVKTPYVAVPKFALDGSPMEGACFIMEERPSQWEGVVTFSSREMPSFLPTGEYCTSDREYYTGIFLPGYGLSLPHVREYLGPRSSLQSHTYNGCVGSLITGPGILAEASRSFSVVAND